MNFEEERLANIQRNREYLQALGLETNVEEQKKPVKQPAKRKQKVEAEVPEKRLSMRIRGKDPNGDEAKTRQEAIDQRRQEEELKKERPKGEISFEVTNQEFIENLKMLNGESASSITCVDEKHSLPTKYSDFHIPIPTGTVKITEGMVYSIAVHPSPLKVLATVGDKSGHLAIWNVTDTLEKSNQVTDEEVDAEVYTYKPHSRAVSQILYSAKNEMNLYTSSHDGSIRLMDLTSLSFKEIYVCEDENPIAQFDIVDNQTLWFCNHAGEIGMTDVREKKNKVQIYQASPRKLNTIHFSTNSNYFTTAGLDNIVRIFDTRKLTAEPEPVSTFTHSKSVNSAYWDPKGVDILSLSFDNSIVLWKDAMSRDSKKHIIRHNNNTGRWIQKFKAVWRPFVDGAGESVFCVGNMKRAVDLYSGNDGKQIASLQDEGLTAIPAVNAFHPTIDLIISGNASGRMCVWNNTGPNEI